MKSVDESTEKSVELGILSKFFEFCEKKKTMFQLLSYALFLINTLVLNSSKWLDTLNCPKFFDILLFLSSSTIFLVNIAIILGNEGLNEFHRNTERKKNLGNELNEIKIDLGSKGLSSKEINKKRKDKKKIKKELKILDEYFYKSDKNIRNADFQIIITIFSVIALFKASFDFNYSSLFLIYLLILCICIIFLYLTKGILLKILSFLLTLYVLYILGYLGYMILPQLLNDYIFNTPQL